MITTSARLCPYHGLAHATLVSYSASQNVIPTFYGVKYVDSNLVDYNKCVEMDGGKYNMLWAPEPKLQALPFGATYDIAAVRPVSFTFLLPLVWTYGCVALPTRCRGFVLAENYYCQYLRNVTDAYASGTTRLGLFWQQQ